MDGDADAFMTPLASSGPGNPMVPSSHTTATNQPHRVQNANTYDAQREEIENKFAEKHTEKTSDNSNKDEMADFSTPISDLMGAPEPMGGVPPMPAQDPRMAAGMPPQDQFHVVPVPPPQAVPQAVPAHAAPHKQNIGGLTDDQLDAVLAGIIVAGLMSPAAQAKLYTFAPQFADRGMTGLLASGAVGAAVFFGMKKFVLKN
jgi:hypothetical protein